jgi:glutaconate CoA-transferase subunit B
VFRFDPAAGRFALVSVHPGETVEGVRAATGFSYDTPTHPEFTADPSEQELALLRGPVRARMAPTYPAFCRRVWEAAQERHG